MDFEAWAQSVWSQFAAVARVPIPFLAALIVSWIVIRWHARQQLRNRIGNLQVLADLRDAQLQDYKDKLDGASADQAKARMGALESRLYEVLAQVAALAPRTLSDQQRRAALAVLDRFRGSRVVVVSDAEAPDVKRLAESLTATFHGAAWHVETGIALEMEERPATGVGLLVADPARLTLPQQSIAEALRDAGLAFD
ncbi:MAG: hypothetical protein JO276_08340, partial [Sphingomonadaceae bacterium]|nr:hypothetical protein [Sphingomonadaceae bacterium]